MQTLWQRYKRREYKRRIEMKCSNCSDEIELFDVVVSGISGERFCSYKCLLEKHPEYNKSEMERVHDLKDKFEKEIDKKRGRNV